MFKLKTKSSHLLYTLLVVVLFSFTSCINNPTYPYYTLDQTRTIPDSLKEKHREWIKETVRATNQHLSAGRYENVTESIQQAKYTADELFGVLEFGLRKHQNQYYSDDIIIEKSKMTVVQLNILDSLQNNH